MYLFNKVNSYSNIDATDHTRYDLRLTYNGSNVDVSTDYTQNIQIVQGTIPLSGYYNIGVYQNSGKGQDHLTRDLIAYY